jgi:hypothetical protein
LPAKKPGKRRRRTKLGVISDARIAQRDLRQRELKAKIIKEYEQKMANSKKKSSINASSLVDESTKMDEEC